MAVAGSHSSIASEDIFLKPYLDSIFGRLSMLDISNDMGATVF